jgi:hypothetical protein
MARRSVQHHSGFTFNYTDLNENVFPPKDSCIADSMGWTDIDGDGTIDFVCIGTASGDYDDTDHSVVAIHVPSGNRLWTALPGEASKKLALVGNVVVVSTNTGSRLRGLDVKTGQQLWNIGLEDALKEDSFDSDDNAPAIAGVGGPWAAFECIDDSAHIIDVRNGALVKSFQGELRSYGWNLPGLVAFKSEDSDGNEAVDIWDLQAGRSLYKMKDSSRATTIHGGGYFGFMHHDTTPKGDYRCKVSLFEGQSRQPMGTSWLAEHENLHYGSNKYGVVNAFLLGGRILFGDPHEDEHSAWTAPFNPNGTSAPEPWNPPKPGYQLRALGWCAPVLVSVWQKAKGTARFVCCGHDPNTLQILWMNDDLGGSHHHDNPLHLAGHGIFVPRSNDNYYSATNPCALVHIDPNTGQKVMEYAVEATDCVAMAYHFLVGCPDYFSGGVPVVWDTWNRVRVL